VNVTENTPRITANRTIFLDQDEQELAILDALIWPHIGAVIEFARSQENMVVTDVRLNAPFVDRAQAYVSVFLANADPTAVSCRGDARQ
jgi:hypothetical protein